MTPLAEGEFVITPTGRVGMIKAFDKDGRVLVQFGAGGPFSRLLQRKVDRASPDEIADAGLEGVGHATEKTGKAVYSEWTRRFGRVVLEEWPEGLVLRVAGAHRWKSWEDQELLIDLARQGDPTP